MEAASRGEAVLLPSVYFRTPQRPHFLSVSCSLCSMLLSKEWKFKCFRVVFHKSAVWLSPLAVVVPVAVAMGISPRAMLAIMCML